ncbi:unnamed protein product [Allacma fusca]|uniref:Uncharacterized protein n=1 Tax=Allacma fusca TaxID=39272 RepID=A0A8J2K9G7_9HEXA|nr:unnamed protein product [Allacma fusca]
MLLQTTRSKLNPGFRLYFYSRDQFLGPVIGSAQEWKDLKPEIGVQETEDFLHYERRKDKRITFECSLR